MNNLLDALIAAKLAGGGGGGGGSGLTEEFKQALLNAFENVAWKDGDGREYFDAMKAAMYQLSYITAVYTQSGPVYDTDSLDILEADLVVTAFYKGGDSKTVTDYTLSGTLTDGTSTITVSYGDKTATFDVVVTHTDVPRGYTAYDYVKYTGANYSSSATPAPFVLLTKQYADLNSLVLDFDVMPYQAQTGGTAGILGGQPRPAGTGNINVLAIYGRTDQQRISCFSRGAAVGINDIPNMQVGKVVHLNLNPGTESPTTLTADGLSATGAWGGVVTINTTLQYFGNQMSYAGLYTIKAFVALGTLRLYDLTNVLVGEYIPCVRNSDNVIGIYDTVDGVFYTVQTAKYATIGDTDCVYAVGNWEV